MRFFLICFLFLAGFASAQEQDSSADKTAVRICDGRSSTDGQPKISVFLNATRGIGDSSPGNITGWGFLPPGSYGVTIRDGKGKELMAPSPVKLEEGTRLTLVIRQKEEKFEVIPISVKIKESKELFKGSPGAILLVPVNLSYQENYTLRYTNLEKQPASDEFSPAAWREIPVPSGGDWRFRSEVVNSKPTDIPPAKFPPVRLMTDRVVIILLPDSSLPNAEIRVLDGLQGGYIAEEG